MNKNFEVKVIKLIHSLTTLWNESRGCPPNMRIKALILLSRRALSASGKRNKGKAEGHSLLGGFESWRLTFFCWCGLDMVA